MRSLSRKRKCAPDKCRKIHVTNTNLNIIVGHKKLTCACEFYIYSKYKNNNKNNKEKNTGNVIAVIDRTVIITPLLK